MTMEISLQSEGIGLHLECLEIDENDSHSMRYKVKLDLDHPTGTFIYSANDIWLETDMWDRFQQRLSKGLEENAVFHDQSSYFEFSLTRNTRDIELMIKIREPLIESGETSVTSVRRIELDSGFINALIKSFNDSPKFW
jgi:hypothetical protein